MNVRDRRESGRLIVEFVDKVREVAESFPTTEKNDEINPHVQKCGRLHDFKARLVGPSEGGSQ